MNRLILLLVASMFSVLINAQAINTFPWHDDFSTHSTGAGTIVNGWSCNPNNSTSYSWRVKNGVTPSSGTGPSNGNGGNGNYIYTEASGYNQGDLAYLLSPEFEITANATVAEFSFYYHMYGSSMGNLEIWINDGGTYTLLQTISGQQHNGSANAWTKATININAYIGHTIRIRFKGIRGNGYTSDIAIDDFEIDATIGCAGTNSENFDNLTSNSVRLYWSDYGGASSYDIEYGTAGFTQGSGTTINGLILQSKTLNGLTNSTDYEWYVRSDCGANGNSNWHGPFSFTTHINSIANVPWTEDFEGMANTGYNIYPNNMTGDEFWTSSTNNYQNEESASGINYISANGGNDSDTLYSKPFNVTAGTSYDFTYKVSCKSNKPLHIYSCVTSSKTGSPLTVIKTVNLWEISDIYQQFRITYIPTTTEIIYFVIINDGGGYMTYYDDIKVEITPNCVPPKWVDESNITIGSAKLKWEEVGAANAWQIEYKSGNDFSPGTGNSDGIINVNGVQEYVLSNLIHNTEMFWYVRSNCGGGSYSDWTGKGYFKTIEGKIKHPDPSDGENPVDITSRTINWDDVDGADSYRISIGTTSGGNDIANNVACANSEYTKLQNWQYATHYYWTVTIVYSGANTIIGQEYEFSTECEIINIFPYTTGFENGVPEDCWFQEKENGTNGEWTQAANMPNFFNYPAHSGTYMASFNSHFANAGFSTRLYTPQLNLQGLVNPEVNFWMFYESTNSGDNDRVQIQVNNGNGWVNVGAAISRYSSGFGWENHFIDLSAYTNQIIRVAFLGISEHGKQMYIDDVKIQEAPICRVPYNLSVSFTVNHHTRDLIWTEAQGTNAWQIEYGYAGFAQGTGTIVNTSSAGTYHLTGLTAGADYQWYIRSDCGGGSYSDWVGPDAFSTLQYQSAIKNGKTTRCSPTYDRLDANGAAGTNAQYFYDKREFSVTTTGFYDMDVSFSNRVGQVHMYQISFDPQNPVANWIAADDGNISKAENMYLTAGVNYIAVAVEETPISSGDMGNLTFQLSGAEEVIMPYYSDINGEAQGVSGNVPPTNGNLLTADYQCIDINDYTHYYDDNGTPINYSDDNILISAKLNGNNIGVVGDAGFEVKIDGTAGVSLIQPATAPYVQDATGWYVYNRYWKLTPTQQPSTPVNIRYYYQSADFTALQTAISNAGGTVPQVHTKTAYFKINSITGSYNPSPEAGHIGVPYASAYNTDGCWIYTNGAAAGTNMWLLGTFGADFYSEFQIGHFSGGGGGASPMDDDGSPLPLSLLSFYGYADDDINIINWKTSSEKNTREFIIERSENNIDYEPIARVNAAGNSNNILEYKSVDNNPKAISYYHLRTIDNDGSDNLSNTIVVNRNENKMELQIDKLFPNPTYGSISIVYTSAVAGDIKIEISNILGNILITKTIKAYKGGNEINLSLEDLPKGSYLLTLSNAQTFVVKKLIVNGL